MFLREVKFINWPSSGRYPFHLPAFQQLESLGMDRYLTFLVGESGSGKSTLLEAIAIQAGFNAEGGSRNHQFSVAQTESALHSHIRLSWMPKVTSGFFFRAESFFNFASHVDELRNGESGAQAYQPYGGKSLHEQSHGESFLSLFQHRLSTRRPSLYLLDEPEAALSPTRQLALLRILHDHAAIHTSQFIIATHSPILLAFPGATILTFDEGPIHPIDYEETSHYTITRRFLNAPQTMFEELFRDD